MLFECKKCGHIMNTTSTKPRCSKCGSVHLEIYNPIEDVENSVTPPIREASIPAINKKDFSEQMNARILEHFDKMSSIQLLNAMSQGVVTNSPKIKEQENEMSKEIIESLKTSNETLIDSLADKRTEETEDKNETEQKDDFSKLIEFAEKNPDMVKEFLGNQNKDNTKT